MAPQAQIPPRPAVIAATGPKANKRLAQVMPSLLRHLHDFARENEITVDEWTAAVEMVWCFDMTLS
jgi:catechol 1,2-dioxygenase